jgi:ribonuclease J
MSTITVYDGAQGIGGTKLEIRDGAARALFDFGANFTREGLYFEDSYPTKSGYQARLELMRALRLLPPFEDHDFSTKLLSKQDEYDQYPAPSVTAIFLSHAHRDHWGCIPYLNPKIPLHGTPQTLALYRQANIKLPKKEKLNQYANNELFRPMLALGDGEVRVQGMTVKAVRVDHSIPGACGFFITTSDGKRIVYTGDFRLHGTRESFSSSVSFVEQAKDFKPHVLIPEGTNIAEYSNEAEEAHGDEESAGSLKGFLRTEMELAFARDGMVLVGVSGNNIDRIDVLYELVRNLGATLHVSVYNASLLQRLAEAGGLY